jgi:hypothetical protein
MKNSSWARTQHNTITRWPENKAECEMNVMLLTRVVALTGTRRKTNGFNRMASTHPTKKKSFFTKEYHNV